MLTKTFTASPGRVLSRRRLQAVVDALFAATPWLVGAYWRYGLGDSWYAVWWKTGVVFGLLVGGTRFFFANRSVPQVEVDGDGLTYRHRGEVTRIPWMEYQGHRLPWSIPQLVKVLGASGDWIVIDTSLFDDDQRDGFLRELTLHGNFPLPNKRLEPTRR